MESCLNYLGEAAYENETSFVTLGRSHYEKEYLQNFTKVYENFFWKIDINEFRSVLH